MFIGETVTKTKIVFSQLLMDKLDLCIYTHINKHTYIYNI
jgi:hypothetical protein